MAGALCASGCLAAQPLPPKANPKPAAVADATPPPNTVAIDRRPRCGRAADEAQHDDSWLDTPELQRSVHALDEALKPFSASYLGVTMDGETQCARVVFDKDFKDYELVRQRLLGKIVPLKVVLQPSCSSRKQLANADRVRQPKRSRPGK